MSKKCRFRRTFEKQHGKRAQALLKSPSQHRHNIHWLLPSQLSWKKSPLLTCKILGLLVNKLVPEEKNPVLNRGNLTIPIQVQLSQKGKTFSRLSAAFLKGRLNFKDISNEKMTFIDLYFGSYGLRKRSQINA